MGARFVGCSAVVALAAGCGEAAPVEATDASLDAIADAVADAPVDVALPPAPLTVRAVSWNAADADPGAVSAVAEPDGLVVLFGQRGMQVLAGGAVTATDALVTTWRTAGVVPAGDGSATPWTLGVDGMGRVWRVRDRMRLEEVTARYALAMRPVRSLAVLSNNRVAFGYEGGLAVADGMRVTVWSEPAFASLVGAGARVAARTDAGVRVFEPATARLVEYTLAGVTGVAFDAMQRLVVTTGDALYAESAAGLLEARATGAPALRELVRSGDRVWLVAGAQLAAWDGREIHTAPDVTVPADARLLSSPSGDVWALASGRLARYSAVDSPDLRLWEETVRPVFARRCVPCHLAGGSGNLDLTTYASWQMGRANIRTRALAERSMPPPPAALTDDERAALARWLDFDGGAPDAGPVDATVDARADVAADVRLDAGSDVRDATIDARADAAADVRDATIDARVDAATDVRADTAVDAQLDASADGGAVTFAAVNAIFQRACVRCHGASGSLDLGAATAYSALVGRPTIGATCAGGGRVRVVAGDPARSELYLKIAGTPSCGAAMPRGGPALPAADVDTVRRWIVGGAPR